jgi:hypothetical protein
LHAVDTIRLSSLSHARVIQSAEFQEIDARRTAMEREWRDNTTPIGLTTRRQRVEERERRERRWKEWAQNPFDAVHGVSLSGGKGASLTEENALFRGMKAPEEFVIGLEGIRILDDWVSAQPLRGGSRPKATQVR